MNKAERLQAAAIAAPGIRDTRPARKIHIWNPETGQVVGTLNSREVARKVAERAKIELGAEALKNIGECVQCGVSFPHKKNAKYCNKCLFICKRILDDGGQCGRVASKRGLCSRCNHRINRKLPLTRSPNAQHRARRVSRTCVETDGANICGRPTPKGHSLCSRCNNRRYKYHLPVDISPVQTKSKILTGYCIESDGKNTCGRVARKGYRCGRCSARKSRGQPIDVSTKPEPNGMCIGVGENACNKPVAKGRSKWQCVACLKRQWRLKRKCTPATHSKNA